MAVNLKALIGKLNHTTRSAVESAAGLCLSRTHYDVEIEHYLMKLLDNTDGDFAAILKQYGIDRSRLSTELSKSLDHLKTGNARTPALSPHVARMLHEAWSIGSLDYGAAQVRTGHTVIALLANEELARMVKDISRELTKIPVEGLKKDFPAITADSSEEAQAQYASQGSSAAGGAPGPDGKKAGSGKQPNLDAYTVNLTQRAKDGKLDAVLGRDFEIRQVVDILLRRRQNNPILVGEAGVGKTAVAEGFAIRVATGDVPPPLQNVTIHTLDLALLQAGAGVKGEFENRLKGLIEEVKNSPIPIILFIDEAHTMIGAGGSAGQGDAANLLKPALARGELRTIAATTWSEYKKYFEKDPALARRFQLVKIEEPSEDVCLQMMRGMLKPLEAHHKVRILDSGVDAAVRMSHRYLADRLLPDKAVSILDTACARLALGLSATPPAIENASRRIDDLAVQKRVLEREVAVGADHDERLAVIESERVKTEAELKALTERFEKEKGLVTSIRELRGKLEDHHAGAQKHENADAMRADLVKLDKELETLQGETPLMRVAVDDSIIGEVLSGWTGIPVGKMMTDEMSLIIQLEKQLGARVIGQNAALEAISRRVRTSKAGIEDPQKPKGVFMLVGPSGVGKTETALAISDLLFGGEENVITINMSEFQEAHTVSTLKGSPPGYVGYGEGGVLTEAVRRRPYSVVLLDEVEKAHPDVLELFFQVFDKGRMEDGEGREIDFKNTIIILTTNAGTETIMTLTADPETMPTSEGMVKALKPELDKTFKPAFLGRMVIIPFHPVRDENLKQIVRLKLGKVRRRIADTHHVRLVYDDSVVSAIAARCTEVESGARNVDNILTNTLLPEISMTLLEQMATGGGIGTITVGVADDGSLTYHVAPAEAGTKARSPSRRRSCLVRLDVVFVVRGRSCPGGLSKEPFVAYTQTGKPMRVKTPLGPDVLLIERLEGSDGVSRPFELTLDLLSENEVVDPKALLMKPMVVTVDLTLEGTKRYFHGLVRRFSQGGQDDDGLVSYRAEVVPWLWFLSLTTECRIFQKKTVPQIVEQVFKDLGMTDFELQLQGSYVARDYCVQYRETNLDFVSRLMEEEGIFYFFTHTADKHTLVLADVLGAFKPGIVPKLSVSSKDAGIWGEQYISDFEMVQQFTPGKVTLTDYNFETPALSLLANTATTIALTGNSKFELYDFPGNYGKKADGDRFGRIRMEEQEAHNAVIRGAAVCRGLVSGTKLEVDDFYRRDANKQYHLIGVEHSGLNGGYRSKRHAGGQEFQFSETFTAIPASVHFRPPRITPKAVVRGSQTAVVVGPGGEEIYVDKYGRVKVQFFWDRQGKKDEDSSCWVRVSSTWAGKQWGFIQIPRIGQEVLVDFLEGDPDRPIITGSVYNAEMMPPYTLPGNMTQSGLKTRSSSKGSETTFNELRFEDSKGKEELFIHAEKDQKIEVENDETHWVGRDQTITIKGKRTETVTKDETITITDGNHKHTVEKGTQTFIVEGNREITIRKGNDTLKVDTGNRVTELSKGNFQTKVSMGNVETKVSMGNVDTKVDMGNVSVKAGLGAIKYEAMQGIELKVGANSIKVDQTGVTIKGLMVKIEGSVMTEVKGLMTNVKADGILMMKGSLTMIN